MEDCVDEKTFYEKLESLKTGESKVTVYIDDSFYENAKNYLQTLSKFQQGKEHESHAELSKRDISTIKRKGWTLKGEEIVTANNKVVVPKSKLHKVLCECHSSTAHRGRDKTNTYVKGINFILKYHNKLYLCLHVCVNCMPNRRALPTTRSDR